MTDNPGATQRILMVDQLWIWIIDTPEKSTGRGPKTVVTAFPRRWTSAADQEEPTGNQARLEAAKDISDVYGRILSALFGNNRTVSVTDLVCLITDKCSGLFHSRTDEVVDELDYLDVFAVEIGRLASEQTMLANALWGQSTQLKNLLECKDNLLDQPFSNMWSSSEDRGSISKDRRSISEVEHLIDSEMRAMADITKETLCLKVVKDVLDELNSISYIFGQQIAVVQSMVDDIKVQRAHEEKKKNSSTAGALRESNEGNARSQSNPPIAESSHSPRSYPLVDNVETTHGGRVQDSIEDSPEDIELKYTQTLTTLTRRNGDIESLKARAHRVYKDLCDLLDLKQKQASVSEAVSARQEAKETAKQGQTILLFTVITIIFLPLSFIAAVFSMNAHEINPDSDRPISQIFSIMFPATVAILFLSLLLAYNSSITWFVVTLFSRRRNRPGPVEPVQDAAARLTQDEQPCDQAGTARRRGNIFRRTPQAAPDGGGSGEVV